LDVSFIGTDAKVEIAMQWLHSLRLYGAWGSGEQIPVASSRKLMGELLNESSLTEQAGR
jgi:hypothetical protein